MQTRRQSKGLTYFDRLRPRVQIDVGTLEDWYRVRYLELQRPSKRRRLNRTVGEIEKEDGEEEEEDEEVELNRTVEVVNKSMLYDEWYKDFQEQQKRDQKNAKKRKRSTSSRSKSRSPTPVSSKNLQFDLSQVQGGTRKLSLKQGISDESASHPATDSEEENKRELEKIKKDILNLMTVKDEPLTIQQISFST